MNRPMLLTCSDGAVRRYFFSGGIRPDRSQDGGYSGVRDLVNYLPTKSRMSLSQLHFRRHQNRLAHAVQKLFVSRNDCGKRAAQFHTIAFDEVIRT